MKCDAIEYAAIKLSTAAVATAAIHEWQMRPTKTNQKSLDGISAISIFAVRWPDLNPLHDHTHYQQINLYKLRSAVCGTMCFYCD